ncbi:VirB8/TrbF family protein [Paracraurococcus lichenis]|uniref:VirB8/TrbF family protein n=1 Tax=Paracraurococcus lichenis TaxID=3064888 RepID=A0ABT9E6I2_9PROT|nr:VirB8/TrbF family protein [Paracraurococcus sp. LOR1-02]MDO9711778.1 VirB8/TrbF family protein [Paracraurococcus sp. LOR1-02]
MQFLGRHGPTEAVAAAERDAHLAAGQDRARTIAETNRAIRRTGLWVGSIGSLIGVLGMAGMTIMAGRLAGGPERVFIERDPRTGELAQVPRPLEASGRFTDATIRQHLRLVLDHCEAYLYSTYLLNARRCQLFLTPQQQAVHAREVEQTNPDSPIARQGRDGSISVADRVTYEQVAAARDGTQVWGMRYIKVFAQPGRPIECLSWTTVVTFRWRPDLRMADEHRVINLGGMQISDRRSGPDPVRKPEC